MSRWPWAGQEELREAATRKAPRPKFLNKIEPK
jgi:hypothetical protein